jgi:hypothetical protein
VRSGLSPKKTALGGRSAANGDAKGPDFGPKLNEVAWAGPPPLGPAGGVRTSRPPAGPARHRKKGRTMRTRSDSSTWQRVTGQRPCPICEKPDWCLYTTGLDSQIEAVICPRTPSDKECGAAGWLHILRDEWHHDQPWWSCAIPPSSRSPVERTSLAQRAAVYSRQLSERRIERFGQSLGLSAESLVRLRIGRSEFYAAWTFPMHDTAGQVVGIRLRLPNGCKFSVRGGHEGLFIPAHLPSGDRLLIAEGPTDTAALLTLGFNAVGRPSCTGGVKLLVGLIQSMKPPNVVIVADDDPPGQQGAESLATHLLAYCPVKVIAPPVPFKDARAWVQGGATTADVEQAIDAALLRRLAITVVTKGKWQ